MASLLLDGGRRRRRRPGPSFPFLFCLAVFSSTLLVFFIVDSLLHRSHSAPSPLDAPLAVGQRAVHRSPSCCIVLQNLYSPIFSTRDCISELQLHHCSRMTRSFYCLAPVVQVLHLCLRSRRFRPDKLLKDLLSALDRRDWYQANMSEVSLLYRKIFRAPTSAAPMAFTDSVGLCVEHDAPMLRSVPGLTAQPRHYPRRRVLPYRETRRRHLTPPILFGGYDTGVWTQFVTFGEAPCPRFSSAGAFLGPPRASCSLVIVGGCNKKVEALDDMFYLNIGVQYGGKFNQNVGNKLSLASSSVNKPPAILNVDHQVGRGDSGLSTGQISEEKMMFEAKISESNQISHTIEATINGKVLRGVVFMNNHSSGLANDQSL